MKEQEYKIGDLVGEYKPWRHAFDQPFYQITNIEDGKYTLKKIKAKQLNFVYATPVKDSFADDGREDNEITAILFRKENLLARRRTDGNSWERKKYGDFVNYGRIYEGAEYGYAD